MAKYRQPDLKVYIFSTSEVYLTCFHFKRRVCACKRNDASEKQGLMGLCISSFVQMMVEKLISSHTLHALSQIISNRSCDTYCRLWGHNVSIYWVTLYCKFFSWSRLNALTASALRNGNFAFPNYWEYHEAQSLSLGKYYMTLMKFFKLSDEHL